MHWLPKKIYQGTWFLFFLFAPVGAGIVSFLGFFLAELLNLLKREGEQRSTSQDPQLRAIYGFLFLFFGAMTISALLSRYKGISLLSTGGYLLLLLLTFKATKRLIEHRFLQPREAVLTLGAGTLITALWALHSYFIQGYSRAELPFIGFNGLGTTFVLAAGPILGYLNAAVGNSRREKVALAAVLFLLVAALLVTFSRGGWLGFLLLLLVFYLPQRRAWPKLLAAFLILGLVFGSVPVLRERFISSFSLEKNQDRLYVWEAALRMIKDRPLTGVGPGAFPFEYKNYRNPADPYTQVSFAHNLFLALASEGGIPALLFFCLFLGLALWRFYSKARQSGPLLWGVFASVAGVLVHHMVDNIIWGAGEAVYFWAWLALGIYWPVPKPGS